MDGFVQVGDCLVNVLDSLLTKTSSVTTDVHEVVGALVSLSIAACLSAGTCCETLWDRQ